MRARRLPHRASTSSSSTARGELFVHLRTPDQGRLPVALGRRRRRRARRRASRFDDGARPRGARGAGRRRSTLRAALPVPLRRRRHRRPRHGLPRPCTRARSASSPRRSCAASSFRSPRSTRARRRDPVLPRRPRGPRRVRAPARRLQPDQQALPRLQGGRAEPVRRRGASPATRRGGARPARACRRASRGTRPCAPARAPGSTGPAAAPPASAARNCGVEVPRGEAEARARGSASTSAPRSSEPIGTARRSTPPRPWLYAVSASGQFGSAVAQRAQVARRGFARADRVAPLVDRRRRRAGSAAPVSRVSCQRPTAPACETAPGGTTTRSAAAPASSAAGPRAPAPPRPSADRGASPTSAPGDGLAHAALHPHAGRFARRRQEDAEPGQADRASEREAVGTGLDACRQHVGRAPYPVHDLVDPAWIARVVNDDVVERVAGEDVDPEARRRTPPPAGSGTPRHAPLTRCILRRGRAARRAPCRRRAAPRRPTSTNLPLRRTDRWQRGSPPGIVRRGRGSDRRSAPPLQPASRGVSLTPFEGGTYKAAARFSDNATPRSTAGSPSMMRRPIMTTATTRRALRLLLATASAALLASPAHALMLDDRGEMRLGLRAYTAVRVGTEEMGSDDNPLNWPRLRRRPRAPEPLLPRAEARPRPHAAGRRRAGASPGSSAGSTRRAQVQPPVPRRGRGHLRLRAPTSSATRATSCATFRADVAEAEHPRRRQPEPEATRRATSTSASTACAASPAQRNRFFLAYLDFEKGPLFVRIGRQVLAWGETDIFRLLDNINPLDDSFGGFFIALDERRVPLDMAPRRATSSARSGRFQDTFLEGFARPGQQGRDRSRASRRARPGSPAASATRTRPSGRCSTSPTATDVRGGARLVFNREGRHLHARALLHLPRRPRRRSSASRAEAAAGRDRAVEHARASATRSSPSSASRACRSPARRSRSRSRRSTRSCARRWRTSTDEPMNRQGTGNSFDSFAPRHRRRHARHASGYAPANNTEGGARTRSSTRASSTIGPQGAARGARCCSATPSTSSLGLRRQPLHPLAQPARRRSSSSTQFFYKHVFDSPGDLVLPGARSATIAACDRQPTIPHRSAPWPAAATGKRARAAASSSRASTTSTTTGSCRRCSSPPSYSGGRIVPFFGMFYDWAGRAASCQPGVTLVRDPFRFTIDYTPVSGPPTARSSAPCATGTTSASRSSTSSRRQRGRRGCRPDAPSRLTLGRRGHRVQRPS